MASNINGLQAVLNTYANPTSDVVKGFGAFELNNKAQNLGRAGDYAGAEKLHLEALAIKEKAFGEHSIQAALTRNALGEMQLKLGKLDEGQRNLEIAVQIRNAADFKSADAAVSRENLAQLLEAKGNLKEAGNLRYTGAPDAMVCSNFSCLKALLSLKNLSKCSRCKCAYYCSPECQKRDWKTRHKPLCHATA